MVVGLYLAWFVAPPDYQQGETVRIMYLHVPAAWLSMLIYLVMASAALGTLIWRHPLADAAQKAAAPLGAAFTFLCLVTGSLWGKPMWGAWWVWDARLTSVLVLFLIYLALIALWRTIEDPGKAARGAAIFTLVGAINIPIIKFSVDWWNTLHQPASVFRLGGPAIAASMLWPLLVMAHGLHAALRDAASSWRSAMKFCAAACAVCPFSRRTRTGPDFRLLPLRLERRDDRRPAFRLRRRRLCDRLRHRGGDDFRDFARLFRA